jgi:predicted DNA-binding protein
MPKPSGGLLQQQLFPASQTETLKSGRRRRCPAIIVPMSKQISLTLPDELMRRAELFADHSGRKVADVLTDAIEVSLDPFIVPAADVQPLAEWSDEQVLAAADSTMPSDEDRRLTELLDRQQAHILTPEERGELPARMQTYQLGLLHKAQGVAEAVRRGLRPAPLP